MKKSIIKTSFILSVLNFIGCTGTYYNKKTDFNQYTMDIPQSWRKVELKGIDSHVFLIITKNGDSIFSDYGKYSEKFDETNKVFSYEQIKKIKSSGMDITGLYYSKKPEIDQAQGTFLKEYYYYDTINKITGKIKVPKITGKGEVGIYFSNLKDNNSLTISGKNLNEADQNILLDSFKSIMIK